MGRQQVGATQAVIGLQAAPDVNNGRRLFSWMRKYAADMNGSADLVRYGYDRGDAVHSFNGPVELRPSALVTAAVNSGAGSAAGVYKPTGEFQNSISTNPDLDPFHRALYYRMRR